MSTRRRSALERVVSPLVEFLHTEAGGGVILVAAAVAALILANSPWQHGFADLWRHHLTLPVPGHHIDLSLQHWINDGLMTVFFLVVGLEITRELTTGHLSNRRAATLPALAAIGGMVVPALVYVAIAGRTAAHGWGVPMATDIALAVGVLALAGGHAPSSLRAFLLGLAVVDDIGAIVVIAVFYSTGVSFGWLAASAAAVGLTIVLRRVRVDASWIYVVIGLFLWFALHESGVHATIAGVIMGLLVPVDRIPRLEHALHPWTSYLIVPLFALANAGITVTGSTLRAALHSPITWGIGIGLLVGKPLGVLLASWIGTRTGVADRPEGTNGGQLLAAGNAAGIGFTVALFIAELAFTDGNGVVNATEVADAKMAILVASIVSGLLAFAVLRGRGAARGDQP